MQGDSTSEQVDLQVWISFLVGLTVRGREYPLLYLLFKQVCSITIQTQIVIQSLQIDYTATRGLP